MIYTIILSVELKSTNALRKFMSRMQRKRLTDELDKN